MSAADEETSRFAQIGIFAFGLGGLGLFIGWVVKDANVAAIGCAIGIVLPILIGLVDFAATPDLPGATVRRGLFGKEIRGGLDGRSYKITNTTIEIHMPAAIEATLGRRELQEIAAGLASPRTGSFAAKAEFRNAVALLLESGKETVLFLDRDGVRFEGYERGAAAPVLRALMKLAGPGFVIARHASARVCPFCKGALDEAPLACSRCGVEHHAACYEEHGGCAIYGCERAPSSRRAKEQA